MREDWKSAGAQGQASGGPGFRQVEVPDFAAGEEREGLRVRECACPQSCFSLLSESAGLRLARGGLSPRGPPRCSCLPGCLAADWMFRAEFKESEQAEC